MMSRLCLPRAQPRGILGSTTAADRGQADAVSTTGRCPFPVNIRGRVVVSVVRGSTSLAGPDAVSEGDMVVNYPRAQARGLQLTYLTQRVALINALPWYRYPIPLGQLTVAYVCVTTPVRALG